MPSPSAGCTQIHGEQRDTSFMGASGIGPYPLQVQPAHRCKASKGVRLFQIPGTKGHTFCKRSLHMRAKKANRSPITAKIWNRVLCAACVSCGTTHALLQHVCAEAKLVSCGLFSPTVQPSPLRIEAMGSDY
uniref:Uncharacterized protein n=1 Tax=Dunaliella tertiolecta TaxID=3047 RepID=A0A7S3VRP3_DUNTE